MVPDILILISFAFVAVADIVWSTEFAEAQSSSLATA